MDETAREPPSGGGKPGPRSVTYIVRQNPAIYERPRGRSRLRPRGNLASLPLLGWIAILVAATNVMLLLWAMILLCYAPNHLPELDRAINVHAARRAATSR